jgi:hypothetical protein
MFDDITKSVSSWEDMERYGVFALTGEACTLSMRLLCDLNRDGVHLIERFLGGNATMNIGSNWNQSKGAQSSVMLPHGILCELGAFALHVVDGFKVVVRLEQNGVLGVDVPALQKQIATWANPCEWQEAIKLGSGGRDIERYYWASDNSVAGRNVHQMSGRIE